MRSIGFIARCMLFLLPVASLSAQSAQPAPGGPIIRVNSRLVFLDVTVVDKHGKPVTAGLTQDDFSITEDKRPQKIFSFEAPDAHLVPPSAPVDDTHADARAPVTIFVLDELNSSFEDFAFIRYSMKRYLLAQPPQLASPAELMVLGNRSLEMVQGLTQSREELLSALEHVPTALPYKHMNRGAFIDELLQQSFFALQEIALQNKGLPGRKNIIWVGHGSPNLFLTADYAGAADQVRAYMHNVTNMLVDARLSLFVIYPGLKVSGNVWTISEGSATLELPDSDVDPFVGDVNFGVFVNETGGRLFFNRNDVDRQIARSEALGANYYTLTYQPQEGDDNGRFRRIRVLLRNPELRAITKSGYFAPDKAAPVDPQSQMLASLSEALSATIPLSGLHPSLVSILHHPDTSTADFTLQILSRSIQWTTNPDGSNSSMVVLAGSSLSARRDFLASHIQEYELTIRPPQHPAPQVHGTLTLRLRVPRKTQSVRLAVQTEDGHRIGTVDVARKAIDAAPEAPTPEPQLLRKDATSSSPAGAAPAKP
jgi:VWFA-related protein